MPQTPPPTGMPPGSPPGAFPGQPPRKSPGLTIPAEIRAYWEALRGSADFPARDRIDPRGIAGALDQSFLIERVAPGIARFRLGGMRLAALVGMDLRGMPISALISPPDRDRFGRALEAVFAQPSILEARLEAERGHGRPPLSARMMILPLGDQNGQPTLALGCMALDSSDIGRSPRRFALAGLLRETIRPAARPQDDGTQIPLQAEAPAPAPMALAEDPAPYVPAAPRGAHLRLVHDADRAG